MKDWEDLIKIHLFNGKKKFKIKPKQINKQHWSEKVFASENEILIAHIFKSWQVIKKDNSFPKHKWENSNDSY